MRGDDDENSTPGFFGPLSADVISAGLLLNCDVATTASARFVLLDADAHYHNALDREVSAKQRATSSGGAS